MSDVSRFGWIGRKVGMSNVCVDGKVLAVTLVEVFKQNVISKFKNDSSYVVKVGIEFGKLRSKPQIVELQKLDKPLCKITKEFVVSEDEFNGVSESYSLDKMQDEVFLDVTSKNIGKGFAGGMKRWNFKGASASHGASLSHRAIGSTGTREKSWPGKKMPGRLGGKFITMQSLPVVEMDFDLNLVALHGSVPGKAGSIVVLRKAVKKQSAKELR